MQATPSNTIFTVYRPLSGPWKSNEQKMQWVYVYDLGRAFYSGVILRVLSRQYPLFSIYSTCIISTGLSFQVLSYVYDLDRAFF
jgi:hypothetical protein